MEISGDGQFDILINVRCRPQQEKVPQVLFLDSGTWYQAPTSSYYNNFAASCDTAMKICRDGQFDMLMNIRCRAQLKMPPSAVFRQGYKVPGPYKQLL